MKQLHLLYMVMIALTIISISAALHASQISTVACRLDMNIQTTSYGPEGSSIEIEPEIIAYMNDTITVAVVAQGVTDLDTYQVEIQFDPQSLKFIKGYEDVPSLGIQNVLKSSGGTTIGFMAFEKTPGTINIANALVGKNTHQAPDGSGILAVLRFKVLSDKTSELVLKNIYFVDSNKKQCVVTQKFGGKIK